MGRKPKKDRPWGATFTYEAWPVAKELRQKYILADPMVILSAAILAFNELPYDEQKKRLEESAQREEGRYSER